MPRNHYRKRSARNARISTKSGINSDVVSGESVTDVRSQYIGAFLELLARLNSIISGQPVTCVKSDHTPIACTDGSTVYFSSKLLNDAFRTTDGKLANPALTTDRLVELRGVNLHELGHILFSPRKGTVVWKEVQKAQKEIPETISQQEGDSWRFNFRSDDVFRLWNLLEDLRMESLLHARYRNSAPYLTRAVLSLIVKYRNSSEHYAETIDKNVGKLLHLWVYGRRYLPKSVRNEARELFLSLNGPDMVDDIVKFESLIDSYRRFRFPRDGRKVGALLLEFALLYHKHFPGDGFVNGTDTGSDYDGKGGHAERNEGSIDNEAQNEASDELEELDAEDELGSGDATDAQDDGEQGEQGDGDGAGNDNGKDGPLGEGEGDGKKASSIDSVMNKIRDELDDASEQAHADSSTVLKQVVRKVEDSKIDAVFNSTTKPVDTLQPTPRFRALQNAVSTALRQIRADADSTWLHGTAYGSLNVDLAIQAEAQDSDGDIFDQWQDSGDDTPSVEVVILLDLSGSMDSAIPTEYSSGYSTVIQEACASMWAIKRACSTHDLPCTVIGYNSDARVLFRPDDIAQAGLVNTYVADGGTNPVSALSVAKAIFSESESPNKLLVSISDGAWDQVVTCHDLVKEISGLGVQSLFIALPAYYRIQYGSSWETTGTTVPEFTPHIDVVQEYNRGWSKDSEKITIPPFYGHTHGLKVVNPAEMARQIGKLIIKASASMS